MVTVRQIERYWVDRKYERLYDDLTGARPEGLFTFDSTTGRAVPAAALALIRLDELNQSHVPLYGRLVRALLAAQDFRDGGWGDPAVTALCVRALSGSRGNGIAIDRGIQYVAELQKIEGAWPAGPIRRMEADAGTSAFILYELGDCPDFRRAVRFDEAIAWFERHESFLSPEAREWWHLARSKCAALGTRRLETIVLS